jgi:transcription elongation factor Elf1
MTKTCIKCHHDKPIECFLKEKTKSGYGNRCKECISLYQKSYRELHQSQLSEYEQHRYQEDRPAYLKRSKEQKQRDPKGYSTYQKKWRVENREYLAKYILNRLKTDPIFKLKHRLRGSLRKLLKGRKTNSVLKYIGCDVSFLKGYLEAKFISGMTWENHGIIWHIDHIIPCRSFDFSKEDDLMKCYHYTNLQPLLASINCAKQDRLPNGTFARNVLTNQKNVIDSNNEHFFGVG